MVTGPNPVQLLPLKTPFTIPKRGKVIFIVTSTGIANLTFKASKDGKAAGYPEQFSIALYLNNSMSVEGGIWEYVTLTNDADVTVTFAMDSLYNYLNDIASLSPSTPYLNTYNTTTDTLLRSVERIVPRSGVELSYYLDESVAAGGSGTAGPFAITTTSMWYIMGGISQDSLGTSPHASYIELLDPNNDVMFKIKGAVNSPVSYKMYSSRTGNYTLSYENGDSVAHWFFLNLYVVAT